MEEYHNWKKRADASVTENCIFVFFKLAIGHANFWLLFVRNRLWTLLLASWVVARVSQCNMNNTYSRTNFLLLVPAIGSVLCYFCSKFKTFKHSLIYDMESRHTYIFINMIFLGQFRFHPWTRTWTQVETAFRMFDVDQDGFLSWEEFQQVRSLDLFLC